MFCLGETWHDLSLDQQVNFLVTQHAKHGNDFH